jgi:hypothetical protein
MLAARAEEPVVKSWWASPFSLTTHFYSLVNTKGIRFRAYMTTLSFMSFSVKMSTLGF